MKLIVALFLLTVALSSCGSRQPPPDTSWVREIRFSQETKDWLIQSNPPDHVWVDLEKVAKHNDKVQELHK